MQVLACRREELCRVCTYGSTQSKPGKFGTAVDRADSTAPAPRSYSEITHCQQYTCLEIIGSFSGIDHLSVCSAEKYRLV